jgi:hypothetical protein
MEINHQPEPKVLSPDSFHQDILWITPPVSRIHPDSQPDGIHAHIPEQTQAFRFTTIFIIKFISSSLHLSQPTHISTFGKVMSIIRF